MSAANKARKTVLGIEIPRDELALRMLMAAIGAKPPAGLNATEALADAERMNPGITNNFRLCADAAVIYFHQCINDARQPS